MRLGFGACRIHPSWWMMVTLQSQKILKMNLHHMDLHHLLLPHLQTLSAEILGLFKVAWLLQLKWGPLVLNSPVTLLDRPGVQVCRQAWLHILGIGRERLMRCKRNFRGTDGRSVGTLVPKCPKQYRIYFMFVLFGWVLLLKLCFLETLFHMFPRA